MGTTLLEFRTAVKQKLSTVGITTFYSDVMLNQWINDAGKQVTDFDMWDATRHALKIISTATEYYQYPSRFKKNSIFRVTGGTGVDEKEYDVIDWDLFREHRELEDEFECASQLGDQWFIYPQPAVGTTLGIYGFLKWANLTGDTSESILPEMFDVSIVQLAVAAALKKERRYDEAGAEIKGVIGDGGLLIMMKINQNKQKPRGYIGRVRAPKFDRK